MSVARTVSMAVEHPVYRMTHEHALRHDVSTVAYVMRPPPSKAAIQEQI